VQATGGEEVGERPQPRRRVVVAGDRDDRDPGGADPSQDPGCGLHGLGRRHRPVVEVPGDQHGVDPVLDRQVGQRRQHGLLVGQQVLAVEGPAEVPVGGVHQAHALTVGAGSDSVRDRRAPPARKSGRAHVGRP